MTRYHRESSTIVVSRFEFAREGAQLKVENPLSLRTIGYFCFIATSMAAEQRFLPGNFD